MVCEDKMNDNIIAIDDLSN